MQCRWELVLGKVVELHTEKTMWRLSRVCEAFRPHSSFNSKQLGVRGLSLSLFRMRAYGGLPNTGDFSNCEGEQSLFIATFFICTVRWLVSFFKEIGVLCNNFCTISWNRIRKMSERWCKAWMAHFQSLPSSWALFWKSVRYGVKNSMRLFHFLVVAQCLRFAIRGFTLEFSTSEVRDPSFEGTQNNVEQ